MHLWFRTFAWFRNILVFIGVFVGYQGVKYWGSVGNNPNLRPDNLFIISFLLIGIPFFVVHFMHASLTDKMNHNLNSGNELLETGNYKKAVEKFDMAISIKDKINKRVLPEEMIIHLYRAKAFMKLNDEKKALNDLNRITRITSDIDVWKKLKTEAHELKKTLNLPDEG